MDNPPVNSVEAIDMYEYICNNIALNFILSVYGYVAGICDEEEFEVEIGWEDDRVGGIVWCRDRMHVFEDILFYVQHNVSPKIYWEYYEAYSWSSLEDFYIKTKLKKKHIPKNS